MKVEITVNLICGDRHDSKYIEKLGYENSCGAYAHTIREYDSEDSPFAEKYPRIGERIDIWDYKIMDWITVYVTDIRHVIREPKMGTESVVDVTCVEFNRYTYGRK